MKPGLTAQASATSPAWDSSNCLSESPKGGNLCQALSHCAALLHLGECQLMVMGIQPLLILDR